MAVKLFERPISSIGLVASAAVLTTNVQLVAPEPAYAAISTLGVSPPNLPNVAVAATSRSDGLFEATRRIVKEKYFPPPSPFAPTSLPFEDRFEENAVAAALASLGDPYTELLPEEPAPVDSLVRSIAGGGEARSARGRRYRRTSDWWS